MVENSQASVHVGTYRKAGGQGLYPLGVTADGGLKAGDPYQGAANASFAVRSASRGLTYLVDEHGGTIGACRQDAGGWVRVGRAEAQGEQPCYLAIDESRGLLAAANYGSGSVSLFAFGDGGSPLRLAAVYRHSGSGPVEDRQEGPHIHCARFSADGEWLYAVDLGTDAVLRFRLAGTPSLGKPEVAYRAPSGTGPRHLLLHPRRPLAVLLGELASTLTLLEVGADGLRALSTCSTLPDDFAGENLGGHLEWPAEDRVIVSNRGHDSIAVFELDAGAGRFTPLQFVPSGGKSPRHFILRPGGLPILLVAHEKDGAVVSFDLGEDERLAPTGHVATVSGACFLLGP